MEVNILNGIAVSDQQGTPCKGQPGRIWRGVSSVTPCTGVSQVHPVCFHQLAPQHGVASAHLDSVHLCDRISEQSSWNQMACIVTNPLASYMASAIWCGHLSCKWCAVEFSCSLLWCSTMIACCMAACIRDSPVVISTTRYRLALGIIKLQMSCIWTLAWSQSPQS